MNESTVSLFPSSLVELAKQEFANASSSPTSEDQIHQGIGKYRRRRLKARKKDKKRREDVESVVEDDGSESREEIELPEVEKTQVHLGKGRDNATYWHEEEEKSVDSSSASIRSRTNARSTKSSRTSELALVHREDDSTSVSSGKSSFEEEAARCSTRIEASHDLMVTIHSTDLVVGNTAAQMTVHVHLYSEKEGDYLKDLQGLTVLNTSNVCRCNLLHSSWEEPLTFKLNIPEDELRFLVLLFGVCHQLGKDNSSLSKPVAWGFLRLVSRTGIRHLDSKIRLQLFRVPASALNRTLFRSSLTLDNIHRWYQNTEKQKLSSTLHVTVRRFSSADLGVTAPPEEETSEKLESTSSDIQQAETTSLANPFKGKRLPGQQVSLVKSRLFSLSNKSGCLMAQYSLDGRFLACAFADGVIQICRSTDGRSLTKLRGHKGNIYELYWSSSNESNILLSAGADCSCRVWDVDTATCVTLGHPSFVYGAKFKPGDTTVVATACFDKAVRLWTLKRNKSKLCGSYVKHSAPVYCLLWAKDGATIYSGDSAGCVIVWAYDGHSIESIRSIEVSTLTGRLAPLNWMSEHPQNSRIFVHARDSHLYAIDSTSGLLLTVYKGACNSRYRLTSAVSPCGTYLLSGSEDGCLYWFDVFSGSPAAILCLAQRAVITSVNFHPTEDGAVISTLDGSQAVVSFSGQKNDGDAASSGFSLLTFPRTVRSSEEPGQSQVQVRNPTPALDKFESILKKLRLVQSWQPNAP